MPINKFLKSKQLLPGGKVREQGAWEFAPGGATNGFIVPDDGTAGFGPLRISKIELWSLSSEGALDPINTSVDPLDPASGLQLQGTADDKGSYTIEGPSV